MKNSKKILAFALAAVMTFGITACDESTPTADENGETRATLPPATVASTTTDPDLNAPTDKEVKELATDTYTPDGKAGTIKYFGYYDITSDQKGTEQCLIFQSEQYGGTIEYTSSPSGDAYYDKLYTLIAADDSPDVVTGDALLYPGNVSKNLFEPLDDYIDYKSAMWSEMADIIESYEYNGKHYYYPHRITTSFALNYNKKTIEENNLPDPYELYKAGNWTWDAWRSMMVDFVNKDDGNKGFYATDTILTALIATTGTTLVDTHPDGTIDNNLKNPNVSKAMAFYETLCRDGVMNGKEIADWVSPQVFAENYDKLLFLGMEPEWSYIAATEKIQNPDGVDKDIFNTVSDFAFVPFPRDPDADQYYAAYNTFGFVVPKGAKNIKGAVDFINCFRVFDTDENIKAQVKKDHIAPENIYFTKGKYEGIQRWQITWGEQEYDLWREMCDPEKFTFLTEDGFGFGSTFWANYATALNAVAWDGESWTQKSNEMYDLIEAAIDEYRK